MHISDFRWKHRKSKVCYDDLNVRIFPRNVTDVSTTGMRVIILGVTTYRKHLKWKQLVAGSS